MKPLYLDNAATTHISNEVLEAMKKSLSNFGNTEAKYYCYAEDAKEDIKLARERIAIGLRCNSDEVIFTSGATEANNLFIQGMVSAHPNKKRIIISSIEHSSIRETAYHFIEKGYEVIEIPVDKYGLIDTDFLDDAINENTLFVSIILVNNEIGTIQDLKKIDEICIKHKVKLHVDATQAIGKIEINMSLYKSLEYLTCTSHKIYGPKGIGTLIVRKKDGIRNDLKPIIFGGEQEDGYRPGTLSNLLIVGFGKAFEIATCNIEEDNKKLFNLEKVFIDKLKKKFGDLIIVNNNHKYRVPGILNIQFKGINNMILLKKLSPYIAASNGSACSISKPSHVLKAIGLTDDEISNSIRFSFSKYIDIEDLNIVDKL